MDRRGAGGCGAAPVGTEAGGSPDSDGGPGAGPTVVPLPGAAELIKGCWRRSRVWVRRAGGRPCPPPPPHREGYGTIRPPPTGRAMGQSAPTTTGGGYGTARLPHPSTGGVMVRLADPGGGAAGRSLPQRSLAGALPGRVRWCWLVGRSANHAPGSWLRPFVGRGGARRGRCWPARPSVTAGWAGLRLRLAAVAANPGGGGARSLCLCCWA